MRHGVRCQLRPRYERWALTGAARAATQFPGFTSEAVMLKSPHELAAFNVPATEAFHDIPEVTRALGEVRRVLKRSGQLLLRPNQR